MFKKKKPRNNLVAGQKPYPYIVAWGTMMGSFQYYIDAQVQFANWDQAPDEAIYRDSFGKWHTIDDVQDPDRRLYLRNEVNRRAR